MYKTLGLDGQVLLSSRVSLWVKIISRCAKTLSIYFVYLTFVYFWSERIDVFEKFLLVFTYNLLFWRSIVTCNRCNIVSSHKCLTYTNQTFCTMSFNRKLIKFFGGNISKLRGHVCFNFCVRERRADFKARAIIVLRLCTANLLQGATLTACYKVPLIHLLTFNIMSNRWRVIQ